MYIRKARYCFIVLFALGLFVSCSSNNESTPSSSLEKTSGQSSGSGVHPIMTDTLINAKSKPVFPDASPSDVKVNTFKDSLGWGYDILIDGKKVIHQKTIPAVSGNQGFVNMEDSKKTGDLVAFKMRHHIMPPIITVAELDQLKISHK
ncbi:MAG TPA: DUF4907 domain-containing protein [Bacteroidia bacterium]|jgi:hypothetical protein|nr:DUF4907 domain-containing protein [Bacteroidia bacterium]